MSKSKVPDRGESASNSDSVIEILDDCSDSNDSSANVNNIRETRSTNRKTMLATSLATRKMNQLREEGGVTNFNPDKSLREKKKISRVVQATQGRKKNSALYSPTGVFLSTGLDTCDCLEEDCAGCFYPCMKCNGSKCGGACRRRRNWYYENVTIDGQTHSKWSLE